MSQGITKLVDELSSMAEHSSEGSPAAGALRQVAETGRQAARFLDERGAGGLLETAQDFARRKPGAFLIGAALTGRNVRRGLTTIREKVMGTVPQATYSTTTEVQERAQDAAQTVQAKAQSAAESVSETAGQAAQAVREAPVQAMRQTQGNLLAAGLVAFGAGLLASSLLPATRVEQDAVRQVSQSAADYVGPVKEAIAESGQRLKEEVGGTVQDAVQEVKQTAGDAVATTTEQAVAQNARG